MDITFGEVCIAMKDSEKKEAMKQDLLSKAEVLEDENGNTFEIIRIKDLILTSAMIKDRPPGSNLPSGLMLRDCSSTTYRDDDIMVVSFPKTGTHWFSNLIHFLLKTGPLEDELSYQAALIDLFPVAMIDAMPSPRILSTHFPPQYVPSDILKGKGKTILLFRNPKDALVSLYYHLQKTTVLGEMKLSWKGYAEGLMKDAIPYVSFFDFYNSWQKVLEERKDLNILVMYYEKMKKDPLNEMKKLNDFLGLAHDEARLQQVLDKCSLNNLKNDVNTGKVTSPLVDKDGKTILYRKGVIGDWKNHFTVAENEIMDEMIKKKLKDSMFEILY